MKKLFLTFFVLIILSNTLYSNENPKFEFPKYSSELNQNFDDSCSCTGYFSSCSSSGSDCSCSCGYFTCSCTGKDLKQEANNKEIDIKISKEQFKNIEALANVLYELNEYEGVNFLANMIESMKINDVENFYAYRDKFFTELANMTSSEKEKLNSFFINIGAEERV